MAKTAPKFTLADFNKKFPTEDSCLDFLFARRFGKLEECPDCNGKPSFHRVAKRKCYECQWCGKQLFPMSGTIMEKSKTPLQSWLFVMMLFSNSKNGVSAKEIQRQIGVTYKCAFRMGHLVRSLMDEDGEVTLQGEVEIDESLFGGKKRGGKRGWGADRPCVFGMAERGGRIITRFVPNRESKTLYPIITANTEDDITAYTDDFKGYRKLHREVGQHFVIQHSKEEGKVRKHVDGENGEIHTQTIDGAWSLRKRSIKGTYTSVSRKYLQKYLDEFDFRNNHRMECMFLAMVKRLT